MSTVGNIKLEIPTNTQLDEISKARRSDGLLIWRKKDIVAELVNKAYKREVE